ncbi:MAG: ThuA domain-containing protein [Planctomycetota bacterium]
MIRLVGLILLFGVFAAATGTSRQKTDEGAEGSFAVLVFTKTAGFRHDSIAAGVRAIKRLGARNGFAVDETGDAGAFTGSNLARYAVVVFLNTTGDILDREQEAALRAFVGGDNGFVGIHAASDTEHDWAWYGGLVGARFAGHPPVQTAQVRVVDREHPSTRHLPGRWSRRDEWYNFATNVPDGVRVLAFVDESTYAGGTMGQAHPVVWCHAYDGGRSWYTAGGHTIECFAEPLFTEHLLGGILWAAGKDRGQPPAISHQEEERD